MKRKNMPAMKRGSTHFLRFVIFCLGAIAALLCYIILPAMSKEWGPLYPEMTTLKYPFMAVLATTTIPFYGALYQTLKLLGYVDAGTAFSEVSVKALGNIKYCAVAFSVLYATCLPLFYLIGQRMDAPGFAVIGLVMTFAPMVIAVFAAVLQKLLQSAIAIKAENDLTV